MYFALPALQKPREWTAEADGELGWPVNPCGSIRSGHASRAGRPLPCAERGPGPLDGPPSQAAAARSHQHCPGVLRPRPPHQYEVHLQGACRGLGHQQATGHPSKGGVTPPADRESPLNGLAAGCVVSGTPRSSLNSLHDFISGTPCYRRISCGGTNCFRSGTWGFR